MLQAGKYFLEKQGLSSGVSEEELIWTAVKSMGLDELGPFDPKKKIIEYLLQDSAHEKLISLSVKAFANETASDSPAPGGGSVAAAVGAFGVALGTMVANLSAAKRGWEEKTSTFSNWAEKGQHIKSQMLALVDEDTRAFNTIMQAFCLPKDNEHQKAERKAAIQAASKYATEVPFKTLETAVHALPLIDEMVKIGNPNSLSDAGVGAACLLTAMQGAWMNVLINAQGLDDKPWAENITAKARLLIEEGRRECNRMVEEVETRLQA
jgi:glutamate formiminotransferase/formiminotetrahydrofolate cyclodeaminase